MSECIELRKALFWQAMEQEHQIILSNFNEVVTHYEADMFLGPSGWTHFGEDKRLVGKEASERYLKQEAEKFAEAYRQEIEDAYVKWLPTLRKDIDIISASIGVVKFLSARDEAARLDAQKKIKNAVLVVEKIQNIERESALKRIKSYFPNSSLFANPFTLILSGIHGWFTDPDGIRISGASAELTTCAQLQNLPPGYVPTQISFLSVPSRHTRTPKVRMVTLQSGYEFPQDWTELSTHQQKLIEQWRASSPFPTNSQIAKLMNQGPSKKAPDLKKLNEIEDPAKPRAKAKASRDGKPQTAPGPQYTADELAQAAAALKDAVRMEKSGKLPGMKEILDERSERMNKGDYAKMSKEEYTKAETEFDKKLQARMRLDISRAPEQRLVYAADNKAASYSELLPDGTIHTYERQTLGKESYHKSEEWIYPDGTRVSWGGDIEQHSTGKGSAAETHVYKDETIEIYRNPLKQDVYSSSVAQLQEARGEGLSPAPQSSLLESEQIQKKLVDLRQVHRHGPWG